MSTEAPAPDFKAVLEAQHATRKALTGNLARQPTTPREEAAIHQAGTTPVKAIRN